MLAPHGEAKHHPVERQRPRVVRDEQAAPFGRDVLDAVHLDAEVLVVEEVEEGQDLLLVDGVVAELVDLLGAVAQADAAPLAQVEVGREELARRVEHAVGRRPGWRTATSGGSERGARRSTSS